MENEERKKIIEARQEEAKHHQMKATRIPGLESVRIVGSLIMLGPKAVLENWDKMLIAIRNVILTGFGVY